MVTPVTLMKFVPVKVRVAPIAAGLGETVVTVGAGVGGAGAVTVSDVLVTDPVAVATTTGVLAPVDEPAGTVAVIVVALSTE